ncbi:hypothetical protein BLNAU_24445 [Blattamonas nauphoetae]|uniref:Uncharacterized protein n=1 Tax=Blattamonas nauphoetae TaxID=2049346 RepID=A0ABQ9WQ87_9EUKA|nr:hypothetical protein BLNAU_24445 [Blattamonas nauphoetae]
MFAFNLKQSKAGLSASPSQSREGMAKKTQPAWSFDLKLIISSEISPFQISSSAQIQPMHSVLCTTQQQCVEEGSNSSFREESTLPSFCLTTSICCSASLSNSFGERRCFSAVVGAHVNCLVVTCASEDVVGGVCRVRSAGDSFRSPHFSCSELFGFGRGRACHQSVGEQVGSAAPLNTQALFLMLQFASGLPPKLVRPRSLLSTHSHSHSRCLSSSLSDPASRMSVTPTAFVLEPHSSDLPESTNRNASCGRHQQILSAPSECVGQSGKAGTPQCVVSVSLSLAGVPRITNRTRSENAPTQAKGGRARVLCRGFIDERPVCSASRSTSRRVLRSFEYLLASTMNTASARHSLFFSYFRSVAPLPLSSVTNADLQIGLGADLKSTPAPIDSLDGRWSLRIRIRSQLRISTYRKEEELKQNVQNSENSTTL